MSTRFLSARCKYYFDSMLAQRGYTGSMTFNHKSETLSISVRRKFDSSVRQTFQQPYFSLSKKNMIFVFIPQIIIDSSILKTRAWTWEATVVFATSVTHCILNFLTAKISRTNDFHLSSSCRCSRARETRLTWVTCARCLEASAPSPLFALFSLFGPSLRRLSAVLMSLMFTW